jgi:hypothetical protein
MLSLRIPIVIANEVKQSPNVSIKLQNLFKLPEHIEAEKELYWER